uniref:Uncharacterized protein n=1 Tax=Arundo donax TaxID=35708 RepID=A0A0A8ZYE5_ARUDO
MLDATVVAVLDRRILTGK